MTVIHKYALTQMSTMITTPYNFRVLSAKLKEDDQRVEYLYVWILIDDTDKSPSKVTTFEVFNTGQELPFGLIDDLQYVDTVVFRNGTVQHIFYHK